MINVVQQNDLYQISFRYDPAVVDIVRSVPGRSYSPDTKSWTIHKDKLGFLIRAFRGTVYENQLVIRSAEDINKNDTLDSTTEIPDIDISKIPFYVKEGATPYKHQLDFMKYSIDRQQRGYKSGFLLADDQGLAKTCETMNLAIYNQKQYGFRHCLVICCINSSKYNWQEDIKEHTRGAYIPYILGTRMKTRGSGYVSTTSSADKYQDLKVCHMFGDTSMPDLPYFLVINIEAIRYRVGKTYPIADRLIELINSGYINMVAIDEIHKNASPSSMQGKQLLRIKSKTGSNAMWIPMTGTPITSKPTDVFLPLKLVDAHNFTSYYTWCKEFCVYGGYGDHEIVAYKNVPRLKVMLQKNMIRRLKSEVLDLPPKIRYTEYVEKLKKQEEEWAAVIKDLENDESKLKEVVENIPVVGIGDSVMLGAVENLYKQFPNGYFDAAISRTAYVVNDIDPVNIASKNDPRSIDEEIIIYDVETTAFNVTGNSFELVAQKVLTINNICRVTIHNSIFLIPH